MLNLFYFANFMQKLVFSQLEYEQRFGMCGKRGWGKWYMWCGWVVCCEGYTPHIVGWLELWHAPRQAQNWHTDEATLWRQSVTLLPEQRLGQGCLSLCVYGVPQTLTWALPKEKGREREGERGVGRELGKNISMLRTHAQET